MKHSESINELAPALCLAQSQMSGAAKTATNPFFNKKYADLGEVIRCVKEPFTKNDLCFIQFPISEEGRAGVETTIMHKSGQWISHEFTVKCAKNDPQGFGSAITYAKRYGLQAACGIPSEDDDGNAASKPEEKPKASTPAAKKAPAKPAMSQAEAIEILGQSIDLGAMTSDYNKLSPELKANADVVAYCKQRKAEFKEAVK